MDNPSRLAALSIYAALLDDIVAWDGRLHEEVLRLKDALSISIADGGFTFLMVTLPQACKPFDKALSSGYLKYIDVPEIFWTSEGVLSPLFRYVFDANGVILPAADPTAIFFIRQLLLLFKKVEKESPSDSTLAEVRQFVSIDSCLRRPTFEWNADDLGFRASTVDLSDGLRTQSDLFGGRDDCSLSLLRTAQAVADIAFGQFPELDWREIRPRHGPGAVADARSGTDKYLFPSWPEKLDRLFPETFFADHREDLHLTDPSSRERRLEPSARLIAVPKTLKAPRLIASEPVAHQYLQLGIMRWLREHLAPCLRPSIDFLSQAPSQEFAWKGSVTSDIATVDLSAASDRVSCWLVERMLRVNPPLLIALHAARTRSVVNATGVGDQFTILLKKFGAMGAGTTFPLQTLIYTCLAAAAVIFENGWTISSKSIHRACKGIRVFGDDISMPSHAVWSLATLMTHLGLKVNPDKTHWKGYFRESCGKDYYSGTDITPLYMSNLLLRQTAVGISSWIDVCNNAYRQGLWHLSDWMLSQIPAALRRKLPIANSKDSVGCLSLTTYGASAPVARVRMNSRLHRPEVYGVVPYTKRVRRKRGNYSDLLQYFVEEPAPTTKWEAGFTVSSRSLLRDRWVYWPCQ